MARVRIDTAPGDNPLLLFQARRHLLREAQQVSQDTRQRLEELHQRFHFSATVIGALEAVGIQLRGSAGE
jgi:hypothetical protein